MIDATDYRLHTAQHGSDLGMARPGCKWPVSGVDETCPMSHTSEFPRSAGSWAEVRAHDQIVRYRRSGTGRSVVLLTPDLGDGMLWPELVEALDRDFRVLVPELPADAQLMRGLAGFLEGIGTSRVAIVATGALCAAALELALLDRERVARVVLLPCEGDGAARLAAGLGTTGYDLSVPLLVVPRSTAAVSAVARIGAFLGDAWG